MAAEDEDLFFSVYVLSVHEFKNEYQLKTVQDVFY